MTDFEPSGIGIDTVANQEIELGKQDLTEAASQLQAALNSKIQRTGEYKTGRIGEDGNRREFEITDGPLKGAWTVYGSGPGPYTEYLVYHGDKETHIVLQKGDTSLNRKPVVLYETFRGRDPNTGKASEKSASKNSSTAVRSVLSFATGLNGGEIPESLGELAKKYPIPEATTTPSDPLGTPR